MALDLPPTRPHASRHFFYRSLSSTAGLILLALLLGVLLLGGSIYLLTQKTVLIDLDGQTFTINTHRTTVGELLTDLDVTLMPRDTLTPSRSARLENGTVIAVRRALPVLIQINNQQIELTSSSRTPQALLNEAGIRLQPGDRVLLDGIPVDDLTRALDEAPAVLTVLRAAVVIINDGGAITTVTTTEPTVGAMLHTLGKVIYLGDAVEPAVTTPIRDGMRVTITRSVPVTIQLAETTLHTRTLATTVAGALAEAGLPLIGEDYSEPPPEAPLPPDGHIRLVRVEEAVEWQHREIPYPTLYQPDASLPQGETRVVQIGWPGLSERRIRIRYEDGEAVSRVTGPSRIVQEPRPEIIGYGTHE